MTKLLEGTIEKVRALSEPDQDIVAELLLGFADPNAMRFQLSAEQVWEVELAQKEAREAAQKN